MAVADAVSRLPETNCTEARRHRLTARSGVSIRRECRDPTVRQGVDAVTWRRAIAKWRSYIEETRGTSLVFEACDGSGDRTQADRSHRWSPDYQERRYARLKDMERGIDEWYGRATTGLVTLTASSREVPAPIDHLDALLSGRKAALEALRRSLSGRVWDYWWVLEPHQSGYAHLHLAVVVEGGLRELDLAPAVDAHLRQVDAAGEEAHADAVEVIERGEIDNLGAYLNSYLGAYRRDPLNAPEEYQALAAILWATGRRETGASRRLRRFMKGSPPPDPVRDWQLIAVKEPDGTERPVDAEAPGGVDTVETSVWYQDGPRPPPTKPTSLPPS